MSRLTDSVLTLGLAASVFLGNPQTPSTYLRGGALETLDQEVVPVVRPVLARLDSTEVGQISTIATSGHLTHDAGANLLPLGGRESRMIDIQPRLYRDIRPPHSSINSRLPIGAVSGVEGNNEIPVHSQAVRWIQEATGLGEARVGTLLDVTRMTVRSWKAGSDIQPEHRRQLFEVKDVLERAQRTRMRPDQLSAWLEIPDPVTGVTPQALIERGEFDKARLLAVVSDTTVARTPAWAYAPIAEPWADSLEEPESPGEFKDDLSEG